jgi:type I restriction enzyme S subunit
MPFKIPQLHLPMDLESKAILKKTAADHSALDEFKSTDKEINLLKAQAEKLWKQKKGLMQVLLTGKKRLIV